MNITKITAFDLPSVWFQAIKNCLDSGYERPVFRGSAQGKNRKELDFAFLEVTNPSSRPLVPDTPIGVPPPTSLKYVNTYLEYLITPFKKEWEDYTYGERIAGRLGVPDDYGTGFDESILKEMSKIDMIEGQRFSAIDINQFEIIQEWLLETPETNRLIMEIGKPEDLLLRHPPCMRLVQYKVRYGELHMFAYFRSWDAWGGLPSNLGALQLVKEYLGDKAGLKDGKIFCASFGLHIYDDVWDYTKNTVYGIPKEE